MAENKTKPTKVSVTAHIAAIANDDQRRDCQALLKLLRRITGHAPKMWGPTIVGFGEYHYRYPSGREGEACLIGFAARGRELVLYVWTDAPEQQALLARLGKHKLGKVCLYFRRLSDLDLGVLEQLARNSIAQIRQQYG